MQQNHPGGAPLRKGEGGAPPFPAGPVGGRRSAATRGTAISTGTAGAEPAGEGANQLEMIFGGPLNASMFSKVMVVLSWSVNVTPPAAPVANSPAIIWLICAAAVPDPAAPP